MTDTLHQATALIERTRIELEAKGYPPGAVGHALERAREAAQKKVEPISEDIRERAFTDVLRVELTQAENWLVGIKRYLDGQYADRD